MQVRELQTYSANVCTLMLTHDKRDGAELWPRESLPITW